MTDEATSQTHTDEPTTAPIEPGLKGAEHRAKGWFIQRLTEPTTWIGLVSFIATVVGTTIDAQSASMIAGAAVTVTSAALVFFKQAKKETK